MSCSSRSDEPGGNVAPRDPTPVSPTTPDQSSPTPIIIDLTLEEDDEDNVEVQMNEVPPRVEPKPVIKEEPIDVLEESPCPQTAGPDAAVDFDVETLQRTPEPAQMPMAPPIEASRAAEEGAKHELQSDGSIDQMQMLQEFIANHASDSHHSTVRQEANQPITLDSDKEDTQAFKTIKRRYDAKKKKGLADQMDDIELQKACNDEEERRRLRKERQAYQYAEELQDESSLFLPEQPSLPQLTADDQDSFEYELPTSQRIMLAKDVFTQDFDIPESEGDTEPESPRASPPPKRGRKPNVSTLTGGRSRVTKPAQGKPNRPRGPGRGRGGKKNNSRKGLNIIDTNQFFRQNIIEDATANLGQGQQPGFSSTNKQKALTELIASLPEQQRDLHHGDKIDIDKAVKMFRGAGALTRSAMRADGSGGWKLKGMTTSLKHYQLLGAAFLRGRENSKTRPKGGILSDEMGLGKSIEMIANIVDGRSTTPDHATLIVVPSALITQWGGEISKHASEALKDVRIYTSRLTSTDPVREYANVDVVLTSYHEVLRSMPKNEPPIHLVSAEAKAQWWQDEWQKKRGVLHRIKWHRVVLDEAQAIKNHLSKTSEAVCRLQARYKWAISGTPIQNCLEEFYSYFRFLECDHTGSFDLFKKNFCKRGSQKALQRLQVYLTKIMCRRTHLNKMFGVPILQLPPIKPVETIQVEFNDVERAIYQIVRTRFVAKLRALGSKDTIHKNYRAVFVLLLRLRQLVSSPLLIQKTLKELLETEDIERLWELTADSEQEGRNDAGRQTLQGLRQALGTVTDEDPSMQTSSRRSSSDSTDGSILPGPTQSQSHPEGNALTSQFRKYLQNLYDTGKWEDANARSLCQLCDGPPNDPCITSCMHIYCRKCLNELKYAAAHQDKDVMTCFQCGARFHRSEAYAPKGYDEAAKSADPAATTARSTGRSKKKKTGADADEDIDWFTLGGSILQSAKTKGAIKKMEEWWQADPTAKIIIFVQFTGMIKIFRRLCTERNWGHTWFNGELTFAARDLAVQNFTDDPDTKVMIAALKAGGVGLNLVAANRVLIVDLWWCQSVETQAFCRVYRINQTRDVEVARLAVKGTIDEAMIMMQERKTKEIDSAMEEKYRPTRLTTHELLKLFGPILANEDQFSGEDEHFILVDDPFHDVEMSGTPGP